MHSFPYWLLAALALGALLGTFIHPSWIEIVIVWAVLAALCSAWRRTNNRRRLAVRPF